ncbi:MAG: methylenetetrahydrofolate reductase [NAD(P)H] [Saprospiraceae bacterium]|jgi:methylenetetrahydrofolate reductase (NADPH)|nr:methylenetetrahydrofolate reductase [NAD(P)H] [Saprospiraceae bacterium]
MKVTDYFKHANGKLLVSFEVLPPLKGGGMQSIFDMLDPLMEFKPPFIDVTYHREEYLYKETPEGFYEKTAIRKRPGTVGICASIIHRYGVDAVPHLICGGFTKSETEDVLIDLNFLNIKNVLALRGDARKFEVKFSPEPGGNASALELVQQINSMNQGIYLDSNIVNGNKSDFCVGIAGYPEKHYEAPNMELDLQFTKAKVDAGAHYIVTQMFFDNQRYFEYIDKCNKIGINVPIVPGIKPLTKKAQLTSIPRQFYINMPSDLVNAVMKCKNDDEVKLVGIEWCIAQSKELKEKGAPCLHYYTMGDVKTISKIVEAVY